LSAQEYADVKRGGGIPPSVLKNNQLQLDPEQSAAVRERAVAAFTSGKPFVTGSDWDLTIPGIPPNQAAFIEVMHMSANQIASMYGIDPREIGGTATDSLTYSTDESKNLNRASNLRPHIEKFEAAINRVLPERQYVKLDVDATIRADIATRIKVQGWQIADGRLSVNEVRAMEDLPPVKGGDRHNFLLPASVADKPVSEPTRSAPSTEGETQ
jgi:HK97 family phage portal protein